MTAPKLLHNLARLHNDAAELVALRPDVLLAGVGATTLALEQATRTIPIVFAQSIDPVGNSYVESMRRPGGNVNPVSSRSQPGSARETSAATFATMKSASRSDAWRRRRK